MSLIGRVFRGLSAPCRASRDLLRLEARSLHAAQREALPEEKKTVTVLPGDGVGPELVQSVQEVLRAAGAWVDYDDHFLSEVNRNQNTGMEALKSSITRNGVCLMAPGRSALKGIDGELETLNMKLRKELDLYANVVFAKSLPGVKVRHEKPIDLVVIRERTEGEYSAKEHEPDWICRLRARCATCVLPRCGPGSGQCNAIPPRCCSLPPT